MDTTTAIRGFQVTTQPNGLLTLIWLDTTECHFGLTAEEVRAEVATSLAGWVDPR